MIKTRKRGEVIVFELGGILSVTNTRNIWSQVRHVIDDPVTRKVVIDMSGVLTVDSSALGLLVRIAKSLQKHNADLFLAGVSPSVQEVLKVTRLDEYFNIAQSVDEALELLETPRQQPNEPITRQEPAASHRPPETVALDFRSLLRRAGPTISDREVNELIAELERLEHSEKMMALLMEAYEKDLLAKADQIATKRLSVLREVAVGLNHEINNPLTVILATSELLERKLSGRVDNGIIKRLRSIQSQCERIKEIVAKVSAIVRPVSSEYYCGMRMIDVHRSS